MEQPLAPHAGGGNAGMQYALRLRFTRRMVLEHGPPVGMLGAMVLAGCGRPARPRSEAQERATLMPVTVTMWHIWDGNRTPPFHRSLEMLTERRPELRVEPSVFPTTRETEEKIITSIAAGTPPDLVMINQNIFVDLAAGRTLVALDERLRVERIPPSDWYEGAYTSCVWDSRLYGLPAVNSGPRLLYFNRAIFREVGLDPTRPPQTWAELHQASRHVTRRDGESLVRVGWNPGVGSFEWLIFSNNGRLFSPDARQVVFGGPEGLETIEYLTEFVWSVYDGPAPLSAFFRTYGGSFAQDPFITQRAALATSGPFLIPQIREFAPHLDYGVAPTPHAPRGRFADPLWVNWMYSIPVASPRRDGAWEVAKWVGYGEGHRFFMLDQQRPGVIKRYNEDPQYRVINPHWQSIMEILDRYTVPDQVVPGRGQVLAAMNTRLGQVHRRETGSRDGLADAVREAQRELDQAWARVGAVK